MEKQKQSYAYTVITVLLWSTVASAFKISLRYLDFLQLLFYASITSIIFLFVVLLIQNKLYLLKSYSRKDYLYSALFGFLNPFLYYIILFKAYSLLPAQEAQPLNYTWPIMLVLLSIPLLGQKVGRKSFFAIGISFLGVLTISTQGNILGFRFTNFNGALLALGSAVIWALFWIYNKRDKRDDIAKLLLNFIFGFVYLLVVLLFFSKITIPDIKGFLGATYVGLFEMGITFVLWSKALKLSKTTTKISNFIYLVPFLSLMWVHFFVGETILPATVIGLIFIVAGIVLQQYRGLS
ncbi:MAG: DMT family transporter [Caldisericaceae bacterium]|nr:DMT family transporter [Caldisericaceae bacterium]